MTSLLEDHRTKLRTTFIESEPCQRLKVALDRIDFPEHEPNLLITRVSAVEALARSLLVHHIAATSESLEKAYTRYRLTGPEDLLEVYLLSVTLKSPDQFFGQVCWDQFKQAVHYRNLLVHECTYLHPDIAGPLLETCRTILRQLAEAAGLPASEI